MMNQKWKTMAYSIKQSFHEIVLSKINIFNISKTTFKIILYLKNTGINI